jgi:hypothetical protein
MADASRADAYIDHVSRLERSVGLEAGALQLALGGEFEAVGKLEYYLLRSSGLADGGSRR